VGGGQHHLAVLPLHGPGAAEEALVAVERLERAGSLELVDAVLVERGGDGAVRVKPFPVPTTSRIEMPAWRWLLGETADCPPTERRPDPARRTLSESFVAELREVVLTARQWLALVVARLDAPAMVAELRRFPRAHLVYGVLPEGILERLLSPTG
jgi:hypothetical protein